MSWNRNEKNLKNLAICIYDVAFFSQSAITPGWQFLVGSFEVLPKVFLVPMGTTDANLTQHAPSAAATQMVKRVSGY